MTEEIIQREIENIKKVTTELLKSRKAARQFPIDAGIIENEKAIKKPSKKRK